MVMADRALVLCDPLCFLSCKYGERRLNVLTSAINDFYDANVIGEAKGRLLDDVNNLPLTDKLPHIPKRREGANRLSRVIDDIFTVWSFIDEHGLLGSLPRYVSDSVDNMPSLRLFDEDMQFLLARMDKMDQKLSEFGSAIAAITAELQSAQSRSLCPKVSSTITPAQPDAHVGKQSAPVNQPGALMSGNSVVGENFTGVDLQHHDKPATSWAAIAASTMTPNVNFVHHRHHDDKADPYTSHSKSVDEQSFTEYNSRKRGRQRSSQQQQMQTTTSTDTQSAAKTNNTISTHRQGQRLLIGKLNSVNSTSTSHTIAAAKPLIKKAVFYIDNVDPTVSIDDMREFVSSMSVHVLSMFEVKPRRRNQTQASSDSVDCKAFRLCINADHCSRLLIDSKWPAYVSVSEWYFKAAQSSSVQHTASNAKQPPIQPAAQNDHQVNAVDNYFMDAHDDADADATIIVNNQSQSAVTGEL